MYKDFLSKLHSQEEWELLFEASVFRSQLLADRPVAVIKLSLQNLSLAFYKLPGDFLSALLSLRQNH